MKITGTSSHIKVEIGKTDYIIKGERTVNGFLAYLNTISYDDESEKNEVPEHEEFQVKKEVLVFTSNKDFKVEFEEDEDEIDKKVAIKILDDALSKTLELYQTELIKDNYKDIIDQLVYVKDALNNENNRDSFAKITLHKYAQEYLTNQPKYSNLLSEAFGVMSLIKYGKL